MDTAIVLFTRDLRVRDNPALAGLRPRSPGSAAVRRRPGADRAAEPGEVPRRIARGAPGRVRERGGDLVIRQGEPVAETIRLARRTAAEAVFTADDVSRYAARREERLARECGRHRLALEITPGHAVVPPGTSGRPAGRPLPGLHAVLACLARHRLAAALPGAGGHPVAEGVKPGDLPVPDEGLLAARAWR